jgi:hypothetical protein
MLLRKVLSLHKVGVRLTKELFKNDDDDQHSDSVEDDDDGNKSDIDAHEYVGATVLKCQKNMQW